MQEIKERIGAIIDELAVEGVEFDASAATLSDSEPVSVDGVVMLSAWLKEGAKVSDKEASDSGA